MATVAFTAPQSTGTLAEFLAWAGGIQQALFNIGLKQTRDTGQTDFVATVVNVVGTQLSANVATYTCDTTANLRINQTVTVAGVVNNNTIYNGSRVITSITETTFSAAVTNANIAYTADTGTATAVIAASAPAAGASVYQMWKFDDALQSTMPVYLKLVFGTYKPLNYSTNNGPAFYIQVGTGTNGSGTILGAATLGTTTITPSINTSHTMLSSTYLDCYISGDASRLSILLWRNSSWPRFFSIERSKNTLGADTADGVQAVWCYAQYTTTGGTVTVYKGFDYYDISGSHYSSSEIPCISASVSATLYQGTITVFPIFSPFGGLRCPMTSCMSGKYADFSELDEFAYEVYSGTPINYIATQLSNTAGTQRNFGSSTTNAILMRYE